MKSRQRTGQRSTAKTRSFSSIRTPTIVDVAKVAGCSFATVSRALRQPEIVSPEVRSRIDQAVHTLGYVPNGQARALRSSKTRLIGATIPTLDHAIYATLVDSLQKRLAEEGVSLIHNTDGYDLDAEADLVRLLIERGVDGVVLVGAYHRRETLELIRSRKIEFVTTYALAEDPDVPCVGFDNYKAGKAAALYLYDLGHRNFGMIAGMMKDNDRAAKRSEGFADTLVSLGINRQAIAIVEAPYLMESGRAALHHLLDRRSGFTALFCGSDILAVGAMKACRDLGIRVPDRISIVGFDNLEIAQFLSPALTTIDVPAHAMGAKAADYLLAAPEHKLLLSRVELETRLIVRDTTAPPAG